MHAGGCLTLLGMFLAFACASGYYSLLKPISQCQLLCQVSSCQVSSWSNLAQPVTTSNSQAKEQVLQHNLGKPTSPLKNLPQNWFFTIPVGAATWPDVTHSLP